MVSRDKAPSGRRQDPAATADPVLVDGGAVYLDGLGRPTGGLRSQAFAALPDRAPEYLRLAVAHLAARYTDERDLPRSEDPSDRRSRSGKVASRHAPLPPHAPRTGTSPQVPVILVRTSHADPSLTATALRLRMEGRATLPVVIGRSSTLVGPVLPPDGAPCVLCLQRATQPNMPRRTVGEAKIPPERMASAVDSARSLWSVDPEAAEQWLMELELDHGVQRRHHVRRFPDCALCGDRPAHKPNDVPLQLTTCTKSPGSDMGSRSESPVDTYRRLRHLVSPITGAVRHVRRVDTDLPDSIHVYSAGHASGVDPKSLDDFLQDVKDRSGGKGSTAEQARTSALCEALERFSAIFQGDEIDTVGTFAEVENAIDPAEVLNFSVRQYAERIVWNDRCSNAFQLVPEPFDPHRPLAWSRVWALSSSTPAFLPTSLLYSAYAGPGRRFAGADSNGLAAGATREEATLQGLLELVERDAVAVWWYNRLRRPRVDLGGVDDPYLDEMASAYRHLGRTVQVLDLTHDIGIPVFAALSRRVSGPREVVFGFGAHLDPGIALRRCVTEMNQMLVTAIRPEAERRAMLRGHFEDALTWWNDDRQQTPEYLLGHDPDVDALERYAYQDPGDILVDVERCVRAVEDAGLTVYTRDMTRPDLGLPVVKVVVPGLRHFWRRLGPGRLYDVPVTLGWRDRPCAEEDLNPISVFV